MCQLVDTIKDDQISIELLFNRPLDDGMNNNKSINLVGTLKYCHVGNNNEVINPCFEESVSVDGHGGKVIASPLRKDTKYHFEIILKNKISTNVYMYGKSKGFYYPTSDGKFVCLVFSVGSDSESYH